MHRNLLFSRTKEHRSTQALKIIRRELTQREPPPSELSLSHSHSHHHPTSPTQSDLNTEMDPQTLSEAAKKWLRQHRLEGFLTIMEAHPHKEADRVIKEIDTEFIKEEVIRALTGLLEACIFTIDNPTSKQLIKYFREYSLASKAYRTQGSGDMLFREIASVLHEFGHVYPRAPVMPQNRAGLIIATYEGVKVDWPVLIADGLCTAIETVKGKDGKEGKEGRKIWHVVTQWLTLLAPRVEPVQTKKWARAADGTPKTASKRQ